MARKISFKADVRDVEYGDAGIAKGEVTVADDATAEQIEVGISRLVSREWRGTHATNIRTSE